MDAINPNKKVQLAEQLNTNSQAKVMSLIPQFSEAKIHVCKECKPHSIENIHALVFNMERGHNWREIIDFLKYSPDIQPFDLILANELDDGCTRTGEVDVTREIAEALNMHYVYALEFVELMQTTASKGYHGNAILSRYPIRWAEVFHLPEENNWFFEKQKRIGSRNAIFAELDVGGRPLGIASIHLENKTSETGRRRQMQAICDRAKELFSEETPILLGGDLNTNTFDGRDIDAIQWLADHPDLLQKRVEKPENYESLLIASEDSGFEFRESACKGITRRKPLPDGKSLELLLDWFLSRGLEVIDSRIISTLTKDCQFAPSGSALAELQTEELSDHNAVWAKYSYPDTK